MAENPNLNVNRKRGAEFKDRIKENCHEIKDKLEEYTSATSTAIQEQLKMTLIDLI